MYYTGQYTHGYEQHTKVADLNPSVPSGEYELVQGCGKNEDIQFDFSNPLYAEPEKEVVSAIYESVRNVRFPGFCNVSQIIGLT